jgi:hypothetical protein
VKRVQSIRIYIPVLLLLALAACTAPASIQTPEGKIAYTADQIVLRVGELQNATIQAERTGGIPTAAARTIVEFTVSANKILRDTPAGWQATIATSWRELKPKISAAVRDKLAVVWAAVDFLVLTVGGVS